MLVSGVTGIICAIDVEAAPFLRTMTDISVSTHAMLQIQEGFIADKPVAVVRCGVCKVNAAIAAQVLINHFRVSRVIVSGTAGGIDKRLHIGDTVVSTDTAYHDVQDNILTSQHPYMTDPIFNTNAELLAAATRAVQTDTLSHPVYFGRIVTGEAFISTEGREEIIRRFNPLCVDMETAAAAHVCYVNQTPFLAVRSISDTEDDAGYGSFFQNAEMASEHSFLVVKALLHELC